jgi:hypothetical protein
MRYTCGGGYSGENFAGEVYDILECKVEVVKRRL